MQILQYKIVDGRELNIGCSLQTFVNDTVLELAENPSNSNIKLVCCKPDYFVFQYVHDTSEEDLRPP